ncbi:MAG: hypothetical protein IPM39_29330 [Chloroflexi bacterium]|nr:hypothetical protein [Chloroflexota bacterium]
MDENAERETRNGEQGKNPVHRLIRSPFTHPHAGTGAFAANSVACLAKPILWYKAKHLSPMRRTPPLGFFVNRETGVIEEEG